MTQLLIPVVQLNKDLTQNDILSQLPALLTDHADMRITTPTKQFWTDLAISEERINTSVICGIFDNEKLVCFAGVNLDSDLKIRFAVVITARKYRKQGLAKQVLRGLIDKLSKYGIKYQSLVAQDNEASRNLYESLGLQVIESRHATRTSRAFIQLLYSN